MYYVITKTTVEYIYFSQLKNMNFDYFILASAATWANTLFIPTFINMNGNMVYCLLKSCKCSFFFSGICLLCHLWDGTEIQNDYVSNVRIHQIIFMLSAVYYYFLSYRASMFIYSFKVILCVWYFLFLRLHDETSYNNSTNSKYDKILVQLIKVLLVVDKC